MEGKTGSMVQSTETTRNTIVDGLQGINNYLAMINSRVEILLLADPPEYLLSDLIGIYQAEKEAIRIVHSMKFYVIHLFNSCDLIGNKPNNKNQSSTNII